MTDTQSMTSSENKKIYRVAHVSDDNMSVVINAGSKDGIRRGQRFIVYEKSTAPITDPVTEEPLEHLITIRGWGIATVVQEHITTIKSDRTAQLTKKTWGDVYSALRELYPTQESLIYDDEAKVRRPFDSPARGDYAEPD
jgi:hypothetical protein